MPLVKSADGVRVHYEIHDYTDPWSQKPVLLLQHGFSRTSRYWYNMIPYLARNYRVVCPTLRGFGESEGDFDLDHPIELDDCLADLLAIIDDLGETNVHVAAESLGGVLSMAFAARHPDRVRTLSLMTAPLFIGAHVEKTFSFGYGSWVEALRQLGTYEWSKKANGATRFPPNTDPRLIDWYASESGKNKVGSMVALVKFAMSANVTPLLEKIEAPVLGLYPSASAVATDEQQIVLKNKIRNIHIVHLPASYHMVWVLHPVVCARHILHFAAEHDGIACCD